MYNYSDVFTYVSYGLVHALPIRIIAPFSNTIIMQMCTPNYKIKAIPIPVIQLSSYML